MNLIQALLQAFRREPKFFSRRARHVVPALFLAEELAGFDAGSFPALFLAIVVAGLQTGSFEPLVSYVA
jgi:hypothetical protein